MIILMIINTIDNIMIVSIIITIISMIVIIILTRHNLRHARELVQAVCDDIIYKYTI